MRFKHLKYLLKKNGVALTSHTILLTVVRKLWKKNYGRPVFLEELQATRYFSKVSLDINKIPNSLRQVLPAYSEICIFCVLKNGPPEAVGKDWS